MGCSKSKRRVSLQIPLPEREHSQPAIFALFSRGCRVLSNNIMGLEYCNQMTYKRNATLRHTVAWLAGLDCPLQLANDSGFPLRGLVVTKNNCVNTDTLGLIARWEAGVATTITTFVSLTQAQSGFLLYLQTVLFSSIRIL
jgi:hypothetical protein